MIRRFIDKLLKKPARQKKLVHGHPLTPKKSLNARITSTLSYYQKMLSK